jgi:DNA polymerase I
MPEKRLFLLDSYALAFRMFYAYYKSPLINSAGLNVSMVHGYWGAVLRILDTHKPTHFAIVRDVSAPTFRHELYPEYKANRGPMPEEMVVQMPLLQETLLASGATLLSEPGYEADDVMASVAVAAEKAGFDQIFIVTKDKDMSQIVNEKIHLFHLEKGAEGIDFGPEQVLEKYGVPPSKIRDYLALMGDSSDNIPGVPKIGPKTAAQLLNEFDNIDNLYLNLDKISKKGLLENLRENKEKAFLSRELVTLQSTRGFSGTLEQLEYTGLNTDALTDVFKKNEINSLLRLLKPISDRSTQKTLHTEMDFSKEDVPEYILVDSNEKWESMKLDFESKKVIAVDTETDSLSSMTAGLVGLCLSCDEARGYYIPLAHTDELGLELNNFNKELVSDWFTTLWNDPQIEWVFHNAKFDLHILKRSFGINLKARISDSLIAAWMLSPGDLGLGLDEQVRRHLHHEMIPIENLIGRGKNQITFNRVPVSDAYTYGAEDAVYTLRLWNTLLPKLKERDYEKFFLELEMPCLKVLFEMEEKGVSIDSEELKKQSAEIELRIIELEKEIYGMAEGVEFNIGSPKQLAEVLFDHLELPVIKKTQTGRSTDSVVLEELSVVAPHPIVFAIMEYREIKKLQSTYLSVLPELVNPETKRIHTSFIQWGTATGRLSSREPNLQNIPIRTEAGKKIRAAFVPQKKDDLILSVDYSQIELRMLAHLSGDEKLIAAYNHGADIHTQTAAAIFNVPLSEVTQDHRRDAKIVNFGVLYGMTAFRLARDLKISRTRAKEFIDDYFSLYQGVQQFIDKTVAFAHENGYVETLTGRRRYIPGIDSHDRTECQMAERMAVNTPVQGSAADLIKMAMIRIANRIEKEKLPLKMILQVHDELVFECPKSEVESLSLMVKEEMESAMSLSVPLIASVGYGSNWLRAH